LEKYFELEVGNVRLSKRVQKADFRIKISEEIFYARLAPTVDF